LQNAIFERFRKIFVLEFFEARLDIWSRFIDFLKKKSSCQKKNVSKKKTSSKNAHFFLGLRNILENHANYG